MINSLSSENPAVADLNTLVKLRYGARELTSFPKIQARQMLAGGHRSRFRGRGMDFDQVRIYQPGDDVRCIDWRVTARTQSPHTKIFIEERERPVLIICDLRSGMFFGSQRLKSVVACEVAAALAWAGLSANDRVGGLIFGAQKQLDIKSRRSHHAVLQFIHGLQEYSSALLDSQQNKYNLADVLEESRRFALPGSTIFVVSDFYDLNNECERHLFELARHCNVNFCHIFDPLETQLPTPAIYAVSDGNHQTSIDTGNTQLRQRYAQQFTRRTEQLRKLSEQLFSGHLTFETSESVMNTLAKAYGRRGAGRTKKH